MFRNIVYSVLKIYVKVALHFYFKKYQYQGVENIPEGPLIFIANHQNAFLDALVITCATKRNPFFLARASIFKKKWISYFLNMIRIFPIYRIRDGYSSVKKNDDVIEFCRNLLTSGKSIIIFPEGNHDNRFHLRPFQKGAARIALDSENTNDFDLGLNIVPVGVQYESYDALGKSVLISFGKPMSLKNYKDLYLRDQKSAIKQVTNDMEESIRPLIIDISPESEYKVTFDIWQNLRSRKRNLKDQLDHDQQIIRKIISKELNMNSTILKNKIKWPDQVIHYPLYFITKINLIIPYLLISRFLRNNLKEPMFEGSMKFALWAFPGFGMLILQTMALYLLIAKIQIVSIYFFLTILFGRMAIRTKSD